MQVHSATCSCSGELYQQWFTLADFLPNWNFRGFSLRIPNLYRWQDQRSCDGRGHYIFQPSLVQQGWGPYCDFRGFFSIKVTVERYTVHPWQPEFGPEEKHFVSRGFLCISFSVTDPRHFGVDPYPDLDPRIHASAYWIWMRIRFSSVTFKMPTKNYCLLPFEGTFISFQRKKV